VSQIDSSKKIYIIVHGRRDLMEPVKAKLAAAGFSAENMVPASLDKAGNAGEYVAMLWPPMAATDIAVSQITGPAQAGQSRGMGAWGAVAMKEVAKIPLK
jgi:hypothetical protein